MTERTRGWVCFLAAAVVLGWSVFALGTAVFWQRAVAGVLTAAGGLLGVALLPGSGRLPPIPRLLAGASLLLFGYGWFMAVNAVAEHSLAGFEFTMIENRPFEEAPGSVARSASIRAMLEFTAVLLGMLGVLRAAESSAWKRLAELLAVLAVVVALVGMFHKVLGVESIYGFDARHPSTFFAPYVYNANAGAFMNLCLPLAFGLALARVGDERARAAGGFWALVTVVIASGVVVTASKGAAIILLLSLLWLVAWNRRRLGVLIASFASQRGRRLERVLQVGVLSFLALAFLAIGISFFIWRWEEFFGRFDDPERLVTGREGVIRVMLGMTSPAEGSWHGFGPGTIRHLIPYFAWGETGADLQPGVWTHGHCDPLQTMIEWGWIGALLWLVIGGGGVVCALLLVWKRRLRTEEAPLLRGMVVALTLVGLHSCMDFPLSIYSIHLTAMLLCGVCWGLAARRLRGKGREW